MAIWITSDWHFGHNRMFVWQARGFNSVEEMNEELITRHNSLVQPNDDVYVLGDLMLGLPDNASYIKRLNGKLHLVRGNHDTDVRWELYKTLPNVVELENSIYLKYRKYHFYLSHYPSLTGNLEKESLHQMTLNIYGHTHQRPYMFHAGVDSNDCYPVNIDKIILLMHEEMLKCIEV